MRSRWLGFVVAALVLGFSLWAYPQLPPSVPSHWNFQGDVDAYSSRAFAVFGLPLVIVGLRLLLTALPRIDPLRKNYDAFADTYWTIVNLVLLFMGALQVLVISTGLGHPLPPGWLMPIGLGLVCVFLGNVIGRVQPNWFVGIRTPWTLSSEHVWRRTHRVGGWILVVGGLLVASTGLIPKAVGVPIMTIILGVVAVVPVVYSYYLWKVEQRASSH